MDAQLIFTHFLTTSALHCHSNYKFSTLLLVCHLLCSFHPLLHTFFFLRTVTVIVAAKIFLGKPEEVTSGTFQSALQLYIQSGTAEKVMKGIVEVFGDGSQILSWDDEVQEKLLAIIFENELGGMN